MTISNYPLWAPTNVRKPNNNLFGLKQKTRDVIFQLDYLANSISYMYGNDIHPSQCDASTSTINDIIDRVRRLYGYLEDNSVSDLVNKYEIAVLLPYLEEQLENLCALITDLRPMCREKTKRISKLQKEMQEQFNEILETRGYLQSINPQ